jgi:hypothetical protein
MVSDDFEVEDAIAILLAPATPAEAPSPEAWARAWAELRAAYDGDRHKAETLGTEAVAGLVAEAAREDDPNTIALQTPEGELELQRFYAVVVRRPAPELLDRVGSGIFSDETERAVLGRWHARYGVLLYTLVRGGFILWNPRPLTDRDTIAALAGEMVVYCEDIVGFGEGMRSAWLNAASPFWYLWWD